MTRDRCPLCGGLNACAMAAEGHAPTKAEIDACWCMQAGIDANLLHQRMNAMRLKTGEACICAGCASTLARKAPDPGD